MNNKSTIFCKIEGCLLNENIIIKSITDRINNAYDEGHIIVLLTNKPENDRNKLINLLKKNNIKFSKILMGLPNGPQISINNYNNKNNHKSFSFSVKENTGFESNSHEEYLWDFIIK